jgi:hypothetical protein
MIFQNFRAKFGETIFPAQNKACAKNGKRNASIFSALIAENSDHDIDSGVF